MTSPETLLRGLRPQYVERLERLIGDARLCPRGLIMSGPSLSRALLNAKNGRVSLAEAGDTLSFYAASNFFDSPRPSAATVIPVFSSKSPETLFVSLKLFVFNKVASNYQCDDADRDDAFALASAMPLDSLSVAFCGTTQQIVYTEPFERWLTSDKPTPVPVFEFLDLACSEPKRTPTDNVVGAYMDIARLAALYGPQTPCELSQSLSFFVKEIGSEAMGRSAKHSESDAPLGGLVKQLPDLRCLSYAQRYLLLKTVVLRTFLIGQRVNGSHLFSHIKNVGPSKLKLGENRLEWDGSKETLSILGSCFNLGYFEGDDALGPFSGPAPDLVGKYLCMFAGCSLTSQERLSAHLKLYSSHFRKSPAEMLSYLNEPLHQKLWRLYGI